MKKLINGLKTLVRKKLYKDKVIYKTKSLVRGNKEVSGSC